MPVNILQRPAISFIILALIFGACRDSSTGNNDESGNTFATYRIYHSQNPLLPDSAMAIVQSLFLSNNLPLSNLLAYRLQSDSSGYHHVRCYQFYNGLEFFYQDVIFHFNNQNTFYSLSGELAAHGTFDTVPRVPINIIGKEFSKDISHDY